MTRISLSCPVCGNLNYVNMKMDKEAAERHPLAKVLQTYMFMGDLNCTHCKRLSVATLQVSEMFTSEAQLKTVIDKIKDLA